MKVQCRFNLGKNLSKRTLEAGDLPTTEFQLDIGTEYIVYGISLWRGALYYLTMDKYMTLPTWHPADLFIVTDNLTPVEWYFKYFGFNETFNLNALWGYKELVLDETHYTGLIERENEAIKVFLKRKEEIDEFI